MDFLNELTRIREGRGEYFEKAARYAEVLHSAGATDIQLMTCDICEDLLWPQRKEVLAQLTRELDPVVQIGEICDRLHALAPAHAVTRIQAQTAEGYHTFCFFCDSTVCMNTVEYPDNPDWNQIHTGLARRFAALHPEWQAKGIRMTGCTRHIVVFDVLGPAGGEVGFHNTEFEGCVVQVFLTPEDEQMLVLDPSLVDEYETI